VRTESSRWVAAYVETISLVLGSQWGVLSWLCADPSHAIPHPEKISCGASKAAVSYLTPSESLHHLSQEKRWSLVLHCLNFAASIWPKIVAPRIPAQRRIWDQPRCCQACQQLMRRSQLRLVKVVINRLGRLQRRTSKEKVASDVIALIFLPVGTSRRGHASSIVAG